MSLFRSLRGAAPGRVVVLDPQRVLHRWDDFAADRCHLRTHAFDKIAAELASLLHDAGITPSNAPSS